MTSTTTVGLTIHTMMTSRLLSLLLVVATSTIAHADRPNVVFLLSDDQGWNDYGFMGHAHVQTPNIDIATTILKACGIERPATMPGLDLRQRDALQMRNRVFVDVYAHDSDLDQLADLDNGLKARVVIDGWDKLIARSDGNELYNLKSDPDDRTDLSSQQPEKVQMLEGLIDQWVSKSVAK